MIEQTRSHVIKAMHSLKPRWWYQKERRRPAGGSAQVAMQRWRERMLDSVAAMYEDRYALWGFAPRGRLLRRSVPARRAQARPARFTRVLALCLLTLRRSVPARRTHARPARLTRVTRTFVC